MLLKATEMETIAEFPLELNVRTVETVYSFKHTSEEGVFKSYLWKVNFLLMNIYISTGRSVGSEKSLFYDGRDLSVPVFANICIILVNLYRFNMKIINNIFDCSQIYIHF